MIGLAYCLVLLVLISVGRIVGLPWLNAITAFSLGWGPMMLVVSLPGAVSPEIGPTTWTLVWIATIATALGSTAGWAVTPRFRREASEPSSIDFSRLSKFHLIFIAIYAVQTASQIATLWPTIQSSGGWIVVISGGGNAYRNQTIESTLASAQNSMDASSVLFAIFGYIAFFFGMLSMFTGALMWYKGHRIVAVVPVGIAAIFSVLTLQRSTFVHYLIIFGVALIAVKLADIKVAPPVGRSTRGPSSRRAKRGSAIVGTLALLAGAVSVLFATTQSRSAGTLGLESFRDYFLGGIIALESRIRINPEWAPPPAFDPGLENSALGLGAFSFNGLYSVLRRFGLPLPSAPSNLDFYPIEIFGTSMITNVATGLVEPVLDFGFLGVFIVPFLLAFILSAVQKRSAGSGQVTWVPLISYLTLAIAWSFYSMALSDFRMILVALFGGLVVQRLLGRRTARASPRQRPLVAAN